MKGSESGDGDFGKAESAGGSSANARGGTGQVGMVSAWGVDASGWPAPGAHCSVLGTKRWGTTRSCCTPGAELSGPGEMVGANCPPVCGKMDSLQPVSPGLAVVELCCSRARVPAAGRTAAMPSEPLACAEG